MVNYAKEFELLMQFKAHMTVTDQYLFKRRAIS